MVFPDGYKVIFDTKHRVAELYDLRVDPHEGNNLLEEPSVSGHLGTLMRFFLAHARLAPEEEANRVSDEVRFR